MTKKAKFIVLEGIDGTGKTTTAQKLEEYYISLGKKVFLYHEPYKFASFDVKEIIKNFESEGKEVSDFAVLSLMIASREISIQNILIPELEKNDIVIADRYYYSTYSYQLEVLREIDFNLEINLEGRNDCYPQPNKILFFKIVDMDNYQNSKTDKFEIQDLSKFKQIQENYFDFWAYAIRTELINKNNLGVVEVNQDQQPYFDFNQVLQALEEL